MADTTQHTVVNSGPLHSEEIARRTFDTVRRGFDPAEVRTFLGRLASEVDRAAERETDLRRRLAEAEHRAANPTLDETTLTAALGQQTARVLASAHEAASDVRARAEHNAGRVLDQAREEGARIRAASELVLAERTAEAEAAAGRLLEGARAEATGVVAAAAVEAKEMLREANELRTRMLGDLARRRRVLHLQVERLRAGRESLLEAVRSAKGLFDGIGEGLARAESDARAAAESAARQVSSGPEPSVEELESALALGRQGQLLGPARTGPGRSVVPNPPVVVPEPPVVVPEPVVPEPVVPEPVVPEPVVPEPVVPEPVGEVATAGALEDLFARIRAGRERTEDLGGTGRSLEEEQVAEGVSVAQGGTPDEAECESARQRRDAMVEPVMAGLSRRLKRALQDDQNDLLDRLRSQGDTAGIAVLDAPEAQRNRFSRASAELLERAVTAGKDFCGPRLAPASTDASPSQQAVAIARVRAEELAETLASDLRRRLEEALSQDGHSERVAAAEALGAAYREWKGQRIERLAGDQVTTAFALGCLAATGPGSPLVWVVDDDGRPCPDCDDNALAGAMAPGAEYPTGQCHPPAHPGCRCLLIPARA